MIHRYRSRFLVASPGPLVTFRIWRADYYVRKVGREGGSPQPIRRHRGAQLLLGGGWDPVGELGREPGTLVRGAPAWDVSQFFSVLPFRNTHVLGLLSPGGLS